jgi:phage terminase large subunit-like protein
MPFTADEAAQLVAQIDRDPMSERAARNALGGWHHWARPSQLPPEGDWRIWLLLAGRGFGKTRSGAEWVRAQAESGAARRIALVAPTARDARLVMVEGESGLLAIAPDAMRPVFEPSKRQLTWPNGAIATLYSADEPDRLRGPQFDAAWCDELAAWPVLGEDQGREQIAAAQSRHTPPWRAGVLRSRQNSPAGTARDSAPGPR